MVQCTIDQYFHHPKARSSCTRAAASFLGIPFSIRRLIYAELDLPLCQTIHLNYEPPRSDPCLFRHPTLNPSELPPQDVLSDQSFRLSHFLDTPPTPSIHLDRRCDCNEQDRLFQEVSGTWRCKCSSAPYELLYLHPQITAEVRSLFWSENAFTVCMTDVGGLQVLYALPCNAIQQMTRLVIRLNIYECANGFRCRRGECDIGCHPGCRTRGHDTFIRKTNGYFKSAIRKWKKMCEFLGLNIVPGRLKLAFVCDVDDGETAEEFIAPMKQLPNLKECAVRLGILPMGKTNVRSNLQYLAGETALRLTGRWADQPFRFLDLPQEVQLQILSYTDLLASRDLQRVTAGCVPGRNPVTFFERAGIEFDASTDWDQDHFPTRYFNNLKCCGKCFDVSGVCLCRARHAAFSITCTCWRIPTAIFQVSKKIKQDAESIFYSRNHFVTPGDDKRNKTLGLRKFLDQLPAGVIKYLKHITTISPDLCVSQVTDQWPEILDILICEGNFPKLSLTLDMAYLSGYQEWMLYEEPIVDVPTEEVMEIVMGAYLNVGRSLAKLIEERGRLRNFFFHFSWVLQRPDQDTCRRRREIEIETLALGERYDSTARGKYDRRHVWNGYPCGEICFACPPRDDKNICEWWNHSTIA